MFVTVTTLLCIFLGLWSFVFAPEKSSMLIVLGVVGLLGTLVMPAYGVYFYRKLTRIHI